MNPGIRILPLPSVNTLLEGRMNGQRSGKLCLKADERQVGQRNEDVEENGNSTITPTRKDLKINIKSEEDK